MEISEYFATLCIRRSELVGLQQLPGASKDRITPIMLLAPWLGTSPLERAIQKFEEALGDREYFVDVDKYYRANDNMNQAKEEWSRLASVPCDLQLWCELLEGHPLANPCLQLAGMDIDDAWKQVAWARERGRSFCIRLNMADGIGAGLPAWIIEFIRQLRQDGAADFVVVFEFGWIQEPLQVAALATGLISTFLGELGDGIPICVSSTSFPRDFTPYEGAPVVPFQERQLAVEVARATNHPRIIFGDWGSTRPRSYARASTPKTRIDFPLDEAWVIARGQKTEIDMPTAADRIVAADGWTGALGIWGEQMIQATADEEDFAIETMPDMYCCRVNIHLHRQAFFGSDFSLLDLDEEWPDDL